MPFAPTTAGPDAVEFAESVGLVLDEWQAGVLEGALGEHGDLWAAFEVGLIVGRQNGKGGVLEARELAGALLFEEKLIMHTAHELKTAEEARLRMEQIIEGSSELSRKVKRIVRTNGKESVEFRNGARIKYIARSKSSGRGFSGDLVVMDEAMFLNSREMGTLLPTLAARPNPQVWYTGSAGLAESVHLRSVRERALAGGDPSLAYFEWSVEGEADDVDFDDPDNWYAANPAMGIRISERYVTQERAALDDEEFGRERLGLWDSERGASVIPPSVWDRQCDPASKTADRVAFAVDMTPDRDRTSIGVAGLRDGGVHVEVVENNSGAGWVVPRLVELVERWKPVAVVIDAAGAANSLVQPLEEAGVDVELMSARQMVQACGGFYDDCIEGRLWHLGQPELTEAVSMARKRNLGDAWAWHRRDAMVDISPLVSVTLAKFAVENFEPAEVAEPAVFFV